MRASLSSFSFIFSLHITSKKWMSHQYMLLTWLLPSPYALSVADPGPRLRDTWRIMMVNCESEIVTAMADPVSCWHLIIGMDHDRGGSWWWILMDPDFGLWWQPIVMVDPDHGGCWPWTMITTILLVNQYVDSDTRPLLTIIHPFIDLPLCYKVFILINDCKYPYLSDVPHYMWHLLHFCGSLWGF